MSIIKANQWQGVDGKLRSTILQTVNTYTTGANITTTSNAYVDTGISASFTPMFTNSLIVVNVFLADTGISAYCRSKYRVVRNIAGTETYQTLSENVGYNSSGVHTRVGILSGFCVFNSWSGTGNIRVQFGIYDGSAGAYTAFNHHSTGSQSGMVIQEIAQ